MRAEITGGEIRRIRAGQGGQGREGVVVQQGKG